MFKNRLCTVSTHKVKITLKSEIIYEPASSSLPEKMLIDISGRQSVTIIRTRIAKQSGKYDEKQQQIWTYCTSCIVLLLIIDMVACGVFLFCRV
jgi:hypothetical protein